MKTFNIIAIGVFLSLSSVTSFGQDKLPINQPDYNKPKLFSDLPQKISVRVSDLESLFDVAVGTGVTAKLTDNFVLRGTVVSKTNDASVRSVVINATNRRGAMFTFTKVVNEDTGITYQGRVLSRDHGDAYELVKEHGQYIFQKKSFYEIMSE